MKRYHVKDGGWGYEADGGLWVDYDEAHAIEQERDALKAELALAKDLLEDWSGAVTIPRTNCSCHISAPCNDCYEWSELRETASETKKLLEAK